jgi:hypothetical protein
MVTLAEEDQPMLKRNVRIAWRLTWRVGLVVLIAVPVSLLSTPNRVDAAGGGLLSDVIPFAGILAGWRGRNRIYRTANAYMAEKREYYDRLRAKAQEQLEARQIGGLRDSQVAAYVKVVALIEGERQAMIDFSESEKRAARDAFIEQIEQAIVNRILGSNAATRVLGALAKGVRSSQDLIDRALDELSGGGSGALADVQRVRRIASRMTIAGQLIGGNAGRGIRNAGARIVAAIDRPTGEIQAGLEQVRGELGELGAAVSDLQARGVTPTASQVTREVAVKVVTGEEVDPAVEAIISLLAGKAGREGGTFRGRARSALIGNFVARCAAIGKRYREAVARLEGEAAGDAMSDEQSISICNAIDLDELAEEAQATSQAAMLTETPDTELSSPEVSLEDLCTLLPIDEDLVTDASPTSCVATIDPLVGCSGCNSRMSITQLGSPEEAQQGALSGSCGNPKFSARGDSPLGDAGITCIDISGEAYREGVAQSYYYIIFSYGPYVASISSTFPGQEALVLELGQGIIERIDLLPPAPEGQ